MLSTILMSAGGLILLAFVIVAFIYVMIQLYQEKYLKLFWTVTIISLVTLCFVLGLIFQLIGW